MKEEKLLQSMNHELRRGSLTLLVLLSLNEKQYGYSLLMDLKKLGIEIEAKTLYPLLNRLEQQGLLDAQWDIEGKKPRRYYLINKKGEKLMDNMKKQWDELNEYITRLVGGIRHEE